MNQSTETKELFTALCKAQSQIRGALKDSSNPFFKSKYADLESVWDACRESLTSNGLSVIQTTDFDPVAGVCVVTTLGHSSGQWLRGLLPIMAKSQDPQGIGSAITYARRYALAAIVGVVQVDDDGESAMDRNKHVPSGMPIIRPEQPPAGDGIPCDIYRPNFGQWKGRTLDDIYQAFGEKRMADYIAYIEDSAKKKGHPVSPDGLDFIERTSAFLATKERDWAKSEGSRG